MTSPLIPELSKALSSALSSIRMIKEINGLNVRADLQIVKPDFDAFRNIRIRAEMVQEQLTHIENLLVQIV